MHKDHRARMRRRCLNFGFESYADHEYLEMLLYYSNVRGDTNPIAHALMEEFGSLAAVFEASADELMQVSGVGEQTAVLIKLLTEGLRRFAASSFSETLVYDTVSQIAKFMWGRFLGLDHERLYLLLFNNRMNIIDCSVMADGAVNSASAPVRLMVERAMQKKAACAVIAHNHPHGIATASEPDLDVTYKLAEAMALMEIPLREHLILTDDRFSAIMKHHYLYQDIPTLGAKVGKSGFDYNTFYDVDDVTFRFEPLFGDKKKES